MKQSTKILLLIIAILCVILAIQTCNTNPPTSPIETKQLKQSIATNKAKAANLKPIIIIKDSIRTKYVTRWKEVRHDSLIPCPEKLAIADSLISKDSVLISDLKELSKIDSAIIGDQDKLINNISERQIFYLGCDVTTKGNVYPTIGIDTRKALFTVGYDPFNKVAKLGGYFKIKAWKRR